jgi:excisionase family DNA binding protein
MSAHDIADLLTVNEAARRLRMSRVSLYRAVARGELDAYRVGENGPLRIPADALERFLRPALESKGPR